MDHNTGPLAILTNRKMELYIKDLPACLGRNSNVVDIYLFHESVSREHCVFDCVDHRFTVKDMGSTVGTYINGVRLEPWVPYHIEDGAKISFGKVNMEFYADPRVLENWEKPETKPAGGTVAQSVSSSVNSETGQKIIRIDAREIDDHDYDEADVVYIECGLKSRDEAIEYTQVLEPPAIEVPEAAEEPVVAPDEPEKEPEAAAAGFGERDTMEIEMPGDEWFKAGKTVVLRWTDMVSGEKKELKIDRFPFRIGRREADNDYAIAGERISRKHMRLEESYGEIFIYDDASTNGVKLNGSRIKPETKVKLASGDSIGIPGITFEVSID